MKMQTIMQTQHISPSKSIVLGAIRMYGAKSVLPEWKGTDAEAINMIKKDPRKIFVFGDCDHVGPAGKCLGHRVEAEG